jgi:hypothetical protein
MFIDPVSGHHALLFDGRVVVATNSLAWLIASLMLPSALTTWLEISFKVATRTI